ncbi:putative ribonuclease h protein [Nicotiana attenuata]|uniref:Ribonuclease h protein n=1 Tax=Nicotiana attenuata TaxID=49451 RepID=A0A1J6ICB9_NICAT|nr:putative ribonuclease h protein [Nicotiana attenuata]
MAVYVPRTNWQAFYFFGIEHTTPGCPVQSSIKQPVYISWSFPPSEFIKINTDGSFIPNSRLSGFGGVARDDKGRWIGGFYGRLSMKATSSLTPELWAIHGGLTLAKNYSLKKVIIETDSNDALMLLSVRNDIESHPDHDLIEDCTRLMSELKICLVHTLREGNNCADHLSKLGRKQNQELVILHHPPLSMHQLLLADMTHVAYARYPVMYCGGG